MRALRWHGKHQIRCDTVPDPQIEQPRDAIIKVSSCAICGSDLHLFDGFMPGMKRGDIQLLGVASYAAPLLSTLALVAAGIAQPTWTIALAAVLIAGGAALAARASAGKDQ